MKKKYLSPKSEVIAFALESLMLSTSLPTKDELGADQLSNKQESGWNCTNWQEDCDEE